MTLKEYLQHKAAGEAVPPLDFSNLAVKLLRVSACLCTWHIEQGPLAAVPCIGYFHTVHDAELGWNVFRIHHCRQWVVKSTQ